MFCLRSAVMYHQRSGTKLVLIWPPTMPNLERLGHSLLSGSAHRPLDPIRPFDGGHAHILRPGERLVIAPMAIHLVLNLTPALSVGINFNCPSSVALLTHLNGLPSSPRNEVRDKPWFRRLLAEQVCIGLELKTPAHLGVQLQAATRRMERCDPLMCLICTKPSDGGLRPFSDGSCAETCASRGRGGCVCIPCVRRSIISNGNACPICKRAPSLAWLPPSTDGTLRSGRKR